LACRCRATSRVESAVESYLQCVGRVSVAREALLSKAEVVNIVLIGALGGIPEYRNQLGLLQRQGIVRVLDEDVAFHGPLKEQFW
jgi:hypothetical protein